jgi:hypothetical protein
MALNLSNALWTIMCSVGDPCAVLFGVLWVRTVEPDVGSCSVHFWSNRQQTTVQCIHVAGPSYVI